MVESRRRGSSRPSPYFSQAELDLATQVEADLTTLSVRRVQCDMADFSSLLLMALEWHEGKSEQKRGFTTRAHLKRWGFFTPPVEGADLRAALEASCLRGACTERR